MKQHLNTLYVTSDRARLTLDGETISVSLEGRRLIRIPLLNLEAIQTFGWDIWASPQLVAECAAKGIHVAFCTPTGKMMYRVSGFTPGNVLLRRQQYRLADSADAALAIAREMIAAKVLNARNVLQRAARDHGLQASLQSTIDLLGRNVRLARRAENAARLLGLEGQSAELYFAAFPTLITAPGWSFDARNRRPPRDPVNALLSFAYALLAADCKSAVESVGLDSCVGIYHRDRPGRPGLALDLMEEFRAPLADRLVLSLLNRRQVTEKDFNTDPAGGIRLSDSARKLVLTTWQERKVESLLHPLLQEKITIGLLPHIQARLLAQHIRGALDAYPPMLWK